MLRDAETTSIAETKAVEGKMPSGRRNGATRTMMSRTTTCNISTCSLSTVDQKSFCFSKIFCDARGYTAHERNEDPASTSYINHAARRRDHLYRREDAPLARRRFIRPIFHEKALFSLYLHELRSDKKIYIFKRAF